MEVMNLQGNIEEQVTNKSSDYLEAVEVLTNSFRDYRHSIDERFESIKSQQEAIQGQVKKSLLSARSDVESSDSVPLQASNHLMDYITKGGVGFAVQGGYSVIPEIDFIPEMRHVSVLRNLARIIRQHGGLEHDLFRLGDEAFVRNPGDVPLVEPTPIKVKLHKLELAIFLRTSVTSNTPANFEEIVKHALYKQFAKFENELFISDTGVDGKIAGIGNLQGDGFKTVTVGYDGAANTLYNTLFRMLGMLPGEYMEKAVWMMAPSMFNAIAAIRDAGGRFVVQYDQHNPTLLGLPVHCNERFADTEHQIILANVREGYTLVEHPHILALHDNYRNRDGVTNYFTRLIGGAVTNKEPWVSLKFAGLPAAQEIKFASVVSE